MATDFYSLHCREKYSLPDNWQWFRIEAMPSGGPYKFNLLVGNVVTETYKRGPRKGLPNWGKRNKAEDKTLVLMLDDHQRWLEEWESKSGLCWVCEGSGKNVSRVWMEGNEAKREYTVCRRCKGTGEPLTHANHNLGK